MKPLEELRSLRHGHRQLEEFTITNEEITLEGIRGNVLELKLGIDPGEAREIGVKVCVSPGGEEETVISFLPDEGKIHVDLEKSSLDPALMEAFYDESTLQVANLELDGGEILDLHIFIDRSVLEVFVNNRLCLSHRIYPTRKDSKGVTLFCAGGSMSVRSTDAWKLHASNPF